MKTILVWASLPAAFFGLFAVRRIDRMIPPFQHGHHGLVAAAPGITGPHLGNCTIFPKDNIWNTPIDKLPKHPKSEAYIDSIGPMTKVHPDFGSGRWGIPFTEVPAGTAPAPVKIRYADESDPGPYPIPDDVPLENGGQGDSHIIMIDPRSCMLYELWLAHPAGPGKWTAGSAAIFNLKTNDLRKANATSADAAGLPIFPGLIRYDEVESGEIAHALRFTIPKTQANYVWPGRHKASSNTSTNVPPMGMRFRLRADFDISNYSLTNRVILKALKKYGMFLADNGTAIFITGTQDKRWDDDDLHKLGNVHAEDFEAVDESDLQKSTNSAAINPAGLKQ